MARIRILGKGRLYGSTSSPHGGSGSAHLSMSNELNLNKYDVPKAHAGSSCVIYGNRHSIEIF